MNDPNLVLAMQRRSLAREMQGLMTAKEIVWKGKPSYEYTARLQNMQAQLHQMAMTLKEAGCCILCGKAIENKELAHTTCLIHSS